MAGQRPWVRGQWEQRSSRLIASLRLAIVVCAVALAGCGSGSHPTAASKASSSTTVAGSATTSSQTTPAGAASELSGKLAALPPATFTRAGARRLPAKTTAAERAYLEGVFHDAQRFWENEFEVAHQRYRPARLVLFSRVVHSGCGVQEDSGPFYCPNGVTVYLDLSFFERLADQAGIGPFGQAFVVAHELGHHVQHLLGVDRRVGALTHQNPHLENALSIRAELQADCLAGVWAKSSYERGQLTNDDLRHALKTAEIIGDDFLQLAAGQVPDAAMWTHGSSSQRQRWLADGFDGGRPGDCDTFASAA